MAMPRAGMLALVAAAAMCGAPAFLDPGVVLPGALADEKAPADGSKPGAKAEVSVPRIERAKKLVRELETTLTILRASKSVDAETMKSLEKALEEARKLAVPITAAEMTEDEKQKVGEELAKAAGGDGKEPPAAKDPPGGEWVQRTLDAAFKDVELTEEEQIAASKIITDTSTKLQKAWADRDSKAQSDIKSARAAALEKAVGKKRAQKIVNNLNGMWGRGGR